MATEEIQFYRHYLMVYFINEVVRERYTVSIVDICDVVYVQRQNVYAFQKLTIFAMNYLLFQFRAFVPFLYLFSNLNILVRRRSNTNTEETTPFLNVYKITFYNCITSNNFIAWLRILASNLVPPLFVCHSDTLSSLFLFLSPSLS